MALSANTVWEIRTTGNDVNGGAFVTGASGSDYSQQDAARTGTGTDDSTTDAVANGTTTITSATANFSAAIVGNVIYLQGGTGALAATRRQVVSRTNATTIVVDASVATGTGITMNIGGALASPGESGRNGVAGNHYWLRAGTYTVTSASLNISGGCFSKGTNVVSYWEGYQTTRGDLGTRPLVQADGVITSFALFALATASSSSNRSIFNNIDLDGNARTTSQGISTGNAFILNCKGVNFTAAAFAPQDGSSVLFNCWATGCSTVAAFNGNGVYIACVAEGNTFSGFVSGATNDWTEYIDCLSYNNTGATSDGFFSNATTGEGTTYKNCVAYGNGRDGFRTAVTGTFHLNCIAEANVGSGFGTSLNPAACYWRTCATFDNGTPFSIGTGKANLVVGAITGTASFFTNAAGADFSLNNTAGGGVLLRGTGFPGALPVGGTGYLSVGALQPQYGVSPAGIVMARVFTGA